VGRFGLCYGPFWLYDGPFWTTQRAVLDNFLGIKIFGAVFVGAALAMGRFGIVPNGIYVASVLLNHEVTLFVVDYLSCLRLNYKTQSTYWKLFCQLSVRT